ncbi:MAG: ATP-binding protein [Saprospiraceae bacterium]
MRNTSFIYLWLVPAILLICCGHTNSLSQQGSLLFHHLKLEDGLSELNNEYVYKDSKGFIWISSVTGLNRFDGTNIKKYFPSPKDTLSIFGELVQSPFFEDTLDQLWFTTHDAINCYDRKHDNFHNYPVSKNVVGYHAFYLDPQHDLWFLTDMDTTLYTFNIYSHRIQYIKRLSIPIQRAIAIPDASGQVSRIYAYMQVFPGLEELIIENSKVVEEHILWDDGNKLSIRPKKLVSYKGSILWVVGANELIMYNYIDKSTLHLPMKDILTISAYNDTTLLVSINNQGVYEFDTRSLTFGNQYVFSNHNSLSLLSNQVYFISKDTDEGFWFGSSGIGISYAYTGKKKFNNYNPIPLNDQQNSSFNPMQFILDHSGHLWCNAGFNAGLFELDKTGRIEKKIEGKNTETRKRLNSIANIFEDSKNNFWLSSYSGLSYFSSSFENITHVNSGTDLYGEVLELQDGRLLFSSRAFGLFQMNWNTNSLEQIMPDSLKATYSDVYADHKGRIWASEDYRNIIVLDPATWKSIGKFPNTGAMGSVVESRDGMTTWIASSAGLYDIDSDSLYVRNIYNADDGFPLGLNSMLIDRKNNLWIGSNAGLIVFNPETNTSTIYNYEDGLPATNFNTGAAYQWEDGEMWFGSSKGITKFKPDEIRPINILAIPQITDILVNDQVPVQKLICGETGSTNIPEIIKLTLSYRDNTLTFIVNSLEYSAPKNNKVRYWMEGMDADSIETASGSRIRYTNLPSKKLIFCMQAANSDGKYNPFVRKLAIDITPPYYKTWWFITLTSLALLSLIIYIVYLNFSKKLELQKVRLRLYENLHDDVGSRLTAIVFSADELLHQDKTQNPKIQHISKTARSIVDNMRRLVWAIDPDNDSMNSLAQKIRYDKSLILDDNIQFHLELDEHLSREIVSGEIRYQVTSILNEAMNNISKYAHAKNVWVEFRKKNTMLKIVIRDDGIGFQQEGTGKDKVKASGYGLGNMEKRVSRVKGNLRIESEPGQGTTISIGIPFK